MKNIRNFSIIAHIDHGKSTLADRIIQQTRSVSDRQMREQLLDDMEIERERGITIKAQSVRLRYKDYTLNLIDTPGHVDFSHEVSKSLISSEGALLVVDATQGVQAQTIANCYMAIENDVEIIPVINKIDLPNADIDRVKAEIESVIGIDCSNANLVSAKSGLGIEALLDTITAKIPPPDGDENAPSRALIYDSRFDPYLGALALVRVFDGALKVGQKVLTMATRTRREIGALYYPHPIDHIATEELKTGEIGIVVLGVKTIGDIRVGDTITDLIAPANEPVARYREAKAYVFAGIYPIDAEQFEPLRDALEKLKMSDSSITFTPESSVALGFGFRAGFLGALHMDVIKERLSREFGLDLIATAPSVTYEVLTTSGEKILVSNPSLFPDAGKIDKVFEPYARATVIAPNEFVGSMIALLNDRRGVSEKMEYIGQSRVMLIYAIPLNEAIGDFYDKLKSLSKGYASFDYEPIEYREGNLVKLDIRVAGEAVDALSLIIDRSKAEYRGRELVAKMKELIDRQLFEVAIQASIGAKIIARETVKSVGKNVTAKCYGGDITRKRKLLEKQKEGKKRMKAIGKVHIPQEAFLAVLQIDDNSRR
ncbi:MAG: translation elongation factor 4 [Helicobacteraceae bacterium]|jgi:GTP-binding protein LepA|nr:translation elongation factor 4 [Helicobacteraceae bacterium]